MTKRSLFTAAITFISMLSNLPISASQSAEILEGQITFEYKYLLHLPDGYEMEGKEVYPFVLYLHGSGERGNELNKIRKHGPPKFLDERPDFPAIVVSPQCPAGERWEPLKLNSLIEKIVATYSIDRSRIYLTGNSMGGYGTWALGSTFPDMFAAIAPICGYGNPRVIARNLKETPVWVFHGMKDPVVKIEESLILVRALEAVDGNVKFTVYPEAEHDSWTQTYENPEFWEWLFAQVKPPSKL